MIQIKTLENGIRLVVEEIPSVRSVSLGIFVKTGSAEEDPKYEGISHFIEHMLFKGSENFSAKEIVRTIDRTGGEINAYTGKEATCYYVRSLDETWKTAADVLCDMISHPLFQKEDLDRERQVILEEIRMDEDSPEDVAHEHFMEMVFENSPYASSITGSASSLRRITSPVIRRYHASHYTKNRIVVSCAGKITMEEAEAFFSGKFADLSAGESRAEGDVSEKTSGARSSVTDPAKQRIRQTERDIRQAQLCLGKRVIPLTDPRSYALQIVNGLFGASDSSRLFQEIREEQGLAYAAYSELGFFSSEAYFEIYAGVRPDHLIQTFSAIQNEIRRLQEEPILDEELETARMELKADYVFSGESPNARMNANGKNLLLYGKVFQPEEVLHGFERVTKEDAESVKEQIGDLSQYSLSIVSDRRIDRRKFIENAFDQ
ncbi:MAG: pitrilysin family protein [Eubacteriales bacterium]|nr:pitrilysin family protein [Eubacteriales bacterium]